MEAVQTAVNEMKQRQRMQNERPSLQVSYQDKPKFTLVERGRIC